MKKAKSTEKLIKDIYNDKLQVTTNPAMDKKVLANAINALEELQNKQSVDLQTNIWRIIATNRIIQAAAVLIFLSAICLLTLSRKNEPYEHKITTSGITKVSKTPSELVSAINLNMAFRAGGMSAIEEQFDKAEKKVKPVLKTRLTVDELICEMNGC